jgi:acetylornithine deacetylase/succinyl-diaminopimelate desuccinylase
MKSMTHVPNVVLKTHPIVRSLEKAVVEVTGDPAKVTSFWGWTDAALLTHFAKMPTVIFGPGGAGAHSRVEYVHTNDLVKCTEVYSKVALDICGRGK